MIGDAPRIPAWTGAGERSEVHPAVENTFFISRAASADILRCPDIVETIINLFRSNI